MGTPPAGSSTTGPQDRPISKTTPLQAINGPVFRKAIEDADALLHRHVEALNAINVFPVPDGDTGTNMHLTLRAAVEELQQTEKTAVGDAARALAHGALMGARGNSGVILSQVLRGFDSALAGLFQVGSRVSNRDPEDRVSVF